DVPASDPVVQKAAETVRRDCVNSSHTYSISLAIMFLDRLEEEADVMLIQSMTVRLLAGQTAAGGWTYHCPSAAGDEVRRLTDSLKKRELKGGREIPKKKKPEDGVNRELPKEIQEQLRKIAPPKAVAPQPGAGGGAGNPYEPLLAISRAEGDNSNTQF